jgi:hypothetical protein
MVLCHVGRAAASAAAAALRLSAAALWALTSGPGGMSRVSLASAAQAAALLAAWRLSSRVRSTKAWRSASNGPETVACRGR